MTQYLFEIQVGSFIGQPDETIWSHAIDQQFKLFIEAETLSQANKIIEQRFGNYTRCRYKFVGQDID